MPFREEISSGDRRRALCALRDKLAAEMDAPGMGQSVAALARQLSDVLAQLEAITEPEESARDDLAKRREQRRAAAKVQGGAEGQH